MLKKYNIKSYAIIVVLAVVLILPLNTIAQTRNKESMSKVQSSKKPALKQKKIQKNTGLQKKSSSSVKFSKRIATLEGELSRTKAALLAEQKTGVAKDKNITTLTASIKDVQALLRQRNVELDTLYDEIKGLENVVSERDTNLVTLKDAYDKYDDVITCYRVALSTWDNQRRRRGLSEQDHLTISTILRSAISKSPPK